MLVGLRRIVVFTCSWSVSDERVVQCDIESHNGRSVSYKLRPMGWSFNRAAPPHRPNHAHERTMWHTGLPVETGGGAWTEDQHHACSLLVDDGLPK